MLFVFVETVSLYNSYVESVLEATKQIPEALHFDHLFLLGERDGVIQICDCDQQNMTYQRIPIPVEIRKICVLAGEAYEELKSQ